MSLVPVVRKAKSELRVSVRLYNPDDTVGKAWSAFYTLRYTDSDRCRLCSSLMSIAAFFGREEDTNLDRFRNNFRQEQLAPTMMRCEIYSKKLMETNISDEPLTIP